MSSVARLFEAITINIRFCAISLFHLFVLRFFFFFNFIVPHSYMPPVRGLAPGGLCLNITFYYIVIQGRIGYVKERE